MANNSSLSRKPLEKEPARIRPLATLPVFLTLAGRPALVAGGSAGAAWKAELLAAAGGDVLILAPDPGREIAALVGRGSEAGSLALRREAWSPADLIGMSVAVCDAQNEAEAADFAAAARTAGVPCNTIDRPEWCQFQFGSIVNRSPVVIGISTDGAAPVLGQAIRRRIETLLPAGIAAWGALARRLRDRAANRLSVGAARRRFWERLAERAFDSTQVPTDDETAFIRLAAGNTVEGRVTLVGAGPGDAGLLTVDAIRALQAADVILFDDLVSNDVLELARREAKRMLVGKRAGRPSCKQEDITREMISLARQGRHVVRLKSGDPSIFGRGGEELSALEAAGIPATVVPGVTAASAMATRLGVSLTHRASAQSVRYVTGHGKEDGLPPAVDWRGLADPSCTTIVYMGGRFAGEIARRLIAEGLDPATPAVAMWNITRPGEQRWQGSLAALAAHRLPVETGPVLLGVGQVFSSCTAVRQEIAGRPREAPKLHIPDTA